MRLCVELNAAGSDESGRIFGQATIIGNCIGKFKTGQKPVESFKTKENQWITG